MRLAGPGPAVIARRLAAAYQTAPKRKRRTVIGYTTTGDTTGDRPHRVPAAHLPLHDPNTTYVDQRRLARANARGPRRHRHPHDGRWARMCNGARSIYTVFAHDELGD